MFLYTTCWISLLSFVNVFFSIDALIRNSFSSLVFIVVLCHVNVYIEIQDVFCINYSEILKVFVDMVD